MANFANIDDLAQAIVTNKLELSYSSAKHLLSSNLDFTRYQLTDRKEDTYEQHLGKAFDVLLLTPAKFSELYHVQSNEIGDTFNEHFYIATEDFDHQTKIGKAAFARAELESNGRVVLRPNKEKDLKSALLAVAELEANGRVVLEYSDYFKIKKMVNLMHNDSRIAQLLNGAQRQVEQHCIIQDIPFKMFLDGRQERDSLFDIKSTKDAQIERFVWDIRKYHYDLQGAIYTENPDNVLEQHYYIIACEKETEHYSIIKLENELEKGRQKLDKILRKYKAIQRALEIGDTSVLIQSYYSDASDGIFMC
jgi:PDDEXK-like domain of unknown function (DUF3799)